MANLHDLFPLNQNFGLHPMRFRLVRTHSGRAADPNPSICPLTENNSLVLSLCQDIEARAHYEFVQLK